MIDLQKINKICENYSLDELLEKASLRMQNHQKFFLNFPPYELTTVEEKFLMVKINALYMNDFLKNKMCKNMQNLSIKDIEEISLYLQENPQMKHIEHFNYSPIGAVHSLNEEEKLGLFYKFIIKASKSFKKKSDNHLKNLNILLSLSDENFKKNLEMFFIYHVEKMLPRQTFEQPEEFIETVNKKLDKLLERANYSDKDEILKLFSGFQQEKEYDCFRFNQFNVSILAIKALVKIIQDLVYHDVVESEVNLLKKIGICHQLKKNNFCFLLQSEDKNEYFNILFDKNIDPKYQNIFKDVYQEIKKMNLTNITHQDINLHVKTILEKIIIMKDINETIDHSTRKIRKI